MSDSCTQIEFQQIHRNLLQSPEWPWDDSHWICMEFELES